MDIAQEKNNLRAEIKSLLKAKYVTENEKILKQLGDLYNDISNDSYNIVVLGEFKRGKSTFINALLGKALLPMDVLPETAVINEIQYGEQATVLVEYRDGRMEKGRPDYDYLKQFSARQNNTNIENIKCIRIKYPVGFLRNNITLVDTPGVSDLSEQRAEITYSYIPKANAVVFLLDATSPLKATEYSFIKEKMIPLGVSNIMFIANRYDFVDEDEEPDYLPELEQRLLNTFGINTEEAMLQDITLYPLSATMALQGKETGNQELVVFSGIDEIRQKLHEMLVSGNIEQEKLDSYRKRFGFIAKRLVKDLDSEKKLYLLDKQELEKVAEKLSVMISEAEGHKKSIAGYTEEAREQIIAMTDKSIAHFQKKLAEDVSDMLAVYQGQAFKEYVEITVTKRIKNNYESWLAMYSAHIETLLRKLEMELSQGLSYHFKQQIRVQSDVGSEIVNDGFAISIEAEDISGVNVEAGAKAAAIGIGLFAIAGGGLLPIISLAALPFMREKMFRERLAAAKEAAKPELLSQIAQYTQRMQSDIHDYIEERCNVIVQNTEFAYEKVLADLRERVNAKLQDSNTQSNQVLQKVALLDRAMQEIGQKISLLC